MEFEIGKTYRHTAGEKMKIVGEAETHTYGKCLVGESSRTGELKPIGRGEAHAENWSEVEDDGDDFPRAPAIDFVDMVEGAGGEVAEPVTVLPDGSAFMVASFPLPDDHWLYSPEHEDPPAGLLIGTDDPHRKELVEHVRAAARYAVRAATMNGKELDFDPDALVQNMVVGLLGLFTPDGTDKTSGLKSE